MFTHGPAPSRTGSFGLQLNRSQSNEEQMRTTRYQAIYPSTFTLEMKGEFPEIKIKNTQ
jgi:hypothetical protein